MMKVTLMVIAALAAQAYGFGLRRFGSEKCTYGPAYWCDSLDNAKECSATSHCIRTTWATAKPGNGWMDSSACTFCKDMVADLHKFVANNDTKETILKYLEEACSYMPDEFSHTECDKIGTHYLDQVLAMIEAAIDPDTICSLIGICNSETSQDLPVRAPNQFVSTSSSDGALCDVCTEVESYVKGEVDSKANQDAVKTFLNTQCQRLGQDLAPECEQLADMIMEALINFVDNSLNKQLCELMHMCTSSTDVLASVKAAFLSSLTETHLKAHVTGIASRIRADECTICEEVFNYLHLFINNNETEAEVESLLENDICSQFGELSSECKELVEEYFPQIWKELMSVLDPKTICADLGLCTSSPSEVISSEPTPIGGDIPVVCVLCEYVMEKLVDELVTNATEADIEEALSKVCSLLPSSIRDECDKFVEKYTAEIVNLLTHDVSPKQICALLSLCATPKPQLRSTQCLMCEMALAYVKTDLEKNATQQQVFALLDKLCAELPSDLAPQCEGMVQQFGPNIMKILSDDINAQQLCTDIGMCTSAQKGKADGLVHLYNSRVQLNV
ncbi:prosaposin-like isoform X2 [Watersipora subatra]